jgi:hypothetical protein
MGKKKRKEKFRDFVHYNILGKRTNSKKTSVGDAVAVIAVPIIIIIIILGSVWLSMAQ